MNDPHSCSHDHSVHLQGKALNTALIVAFVFMLVELIGGIVANSLALISDALHMFTDAGALLLSLIILKITQRPRTPQMSYGYHRAEILGALASALSLWALCGVLIYESIIRLIAPEPVKGPIVFVIATIGLDNVLLSRDEMLSFTREHVAFVREFLADGQEDCWTPHLAVIGRPD
ncbi:MAG: cation diffusion facilitator family transporter, partial [Chlamydiota bacterium]